MVKHKKTSSFKESGFYFDDCAICRAMAQAEKRGRDLSVKELQRAFVEQKSKRSLASLDLVNIKDI